MPALARQKDQDEIDVTDARKAFADLLSKVAFASERIVLCRNGKKVAALISMEDLAALKKFEDNADLFDAKSAMKGRFFTPKEARKKLGLA